MILAQWANCTIWEVGDRVRFDPLDAEPYYPPSMPFKGAVGVVISVIKHHGGAQDSVLMQLPDGRVKCAPMCWLRAVELLPEESTKTAE